MQDKTIPQRGGVIIRVYVESSQTQNNNNTHQNPNSIKNVNNPKALPKTPNSTGYDRRAQLLAYSRNLRNVDSPTTTQLPKTKSKKWKWKVRSETPAVRRLPSKQALQRWRYERVGMMIAEVVDQPCRPKCVRGSNKKSTSKTASSSIFRKLKSLLGELSKGCKR